MQSVLIQQSTKGSRVIEKPKIQRRLTVAQQIDHIKKIFTIAQHNDLRDMPFVQVTFGTVLRKSIYGYEPSSESVAFRGPWLDYRDQRWARLSISYDPRLTCLDMALVPSVFGRPHESGESDLLFSEGMPPPGEHFFAGYRYEQHLRKNLKFSSVDGCLTAVRLVQTNTNPQQSSK